MRWTKTSDSRKRTKQVTRYYSAPPFTADLWHRETGFCLQVYSGMQHAEYYYFGANYHGDWAKAQRYANRLLAAEHWY